VSDAAPAVLLASIGQRAAARVLDTIVLVAIVLPFVYGTLRDVIDDPEGAVIPLWVNVLLATVSLVYDWGLVWWRGQTLGKMLLKVRVVDVEGGRPGFSRAGIRAAVPTAVQLVPYGVGGILLLVVYLWAVLDPNRQGLHDKAAGTLVVHRVPAGP
jgi:uncharacterized RDD family membrane protein YckC